MNTILIPLFQNEQLPEEFSNFDVDLDLSYGEVNTIHTLGLHEAKKIIVLGLGDGTKDIKKVFKDVCKEDLVVYTNDRIAFDCGFGLVYSNYSYLDYYEYKYTCTNGAEAFYKGMVSARIVNHARMMADMPSNYMTPEQLVEEAKIVADTYQMEMEVVSNDELEEMGAGGILAVNQGSSHPCFMVVMRYDGGSEDDGYTALVGKGITYDAGGYNIKSNMHGMKYDMCGAANMLATMELLAELKVEANVLCVLAITENKISDHGYVDGDVISSLSGKTIEVTNTDAEGRLILADALTLAQKLGVYRVFDMATLTGACVRALGDTYTGVFTNSEEMLSAIQAACKETKEQIWQLPLDAYFHEQLKVSKVADMVNSNKKLAGAQASFAAAFLEEFIYEDVEWVHIDIAGTSDKDEVATGVMVLSLVKFFENECK